MLGIRWHRIEKDRSYVECFFHSKLPFSICCTCAQIKPSLNSVVNICVVEKLASEVQNCNIKCHREYYNAQQRKVSSSFSLQIRH